MPFAPHPVPEKFCEHCGDPLVRKRMNGRLEDRGVFLRRRFCSHSCHASWQHEQPASSPQASRKRAQSTTGERCDSCGYSHDLTVHHVDGDPLNNEQSNLQTLCRHCHNFWHAMLNRTGRLPSGPMPRLAEWDSCGATAMQSSRKSRRNS